MTPIGVLGGSFDPVHRGHIELACHARRALGLSGVLLLPCAQPPHKPQRTLAAPYHRIEMLYLAVEDRPGLTVCTLEIARGGVCYTIDSLRALRSAGLDPVFLCGSDALADVLSWREHEALLSEFDFAAVMRPEDAGGTRELRWPDAVTRRESPLPKTSEPPLGTGGRVVRLDAEAPAVSSSLIRSRLSAAGGIGDVVPARVARYIQRHRLYGEEGAR